MGSLNSFTLFRRRRRKSRPRRFALPRPVNESSFWTAKKVYEPSHNRSGPPRHDNSTVHTTVCPSAACCRPTTTSPSILFTASPSPVRSRVSCRGPWSGVRQYSTAAGENPSTLYSRLVLDSSAYKLPYLIRQRKLLYC